MDDDDLDFDDWIDNLHGFIHMIQPLPIRQRATIDGVQILSVEEDWEKELDGELSYDNIPRNEKDEKEEVRLEMVKEWHKTLGRPEGLSDTVYTVMITKSVRVWGGGCLRVHMKEYYSGVFLVAVDYLRLELLNIAKVAVYLATQYVQTTTNIVGYGSASLHSPLLGMSPACHTKIGKKGKIKRMCGYL